MKTAQRTRPESPSVPVVPISHDHPADKRPYQRPWCAEYGRVPQEVCEGCIAFERGQNCWERDLTPCCDRDREECAQCPVYVDYHRHSTQPAAVRIRLSDGSEIRGMVYVPKELRLSDFLASADRRFLTVTSARVSWRSGETEELPVVFVAKQQVAVLVPLEQRPGDQGLSVGGEDGEGAEAGTSTSWSG